MHDLDRVLFESGSEELVGEGPHQEFLELLGETTGVPETAGRATQQSLEAYETELAAELLATTSEAELDRFLGSLVSRAAGAAGRFASSPTGRALGGILKDAAKKALPVVGGAVGDRLVPGGSGALWGRRVGNAAGDLFGLELEGLSGEDRELEVARSFVRFANRAARAAASAPVGTDPRAASRAAVALAARTHAPGLFSLLAASGAVPATSSLGPRPTSGRWERRGRHVVLLDV